MHKAINSISVLFFSLFVAVAANAQNWQDKVVDQVLANTTNGAETEFLVVLVEQADVTGARHLRTKSEKGNYVYSQLRDVAARTQPAVASKIERFGAPYQPFYISNFMWVKGGADLVKELALMPQVDKILYNERVQNHKPVTEPLTAKDEIPVPMIVEWGIEMTNANDVWALGHTGQNVVVGGQDTGYDWDHVSISDQYRGNGTQVDHAYNWWDAIKSGDGGACGLDATEPCDDNGHGTHTMGTIVGANGSDEVGMAPDAQWIGCRNMDQGVGTLDSYVSCFEFFLAPTDLDGNNAMPEMAPHVINNSWSCPESEGCNSTNWSIMEMAVENLREAGIVVVVSAGNDGDECETINAPATIFSASFTVGSTRSNDQISGFSSRGPVTSDGSNRMKPDISAPGSQIRSAQVGGGYSTLSGTSMAGPHVAGAVALLISAVPSLEGDVDQIELLLKTSAVAKTSNQTCGGLSGNNVPNHTYGWGRLDVLAAINLAKQCEDSADVEISSISTMVCEDEILLLASTGYSTYAWSDGATSDATSAETGGTYSVTATDAAGCPSMATIEIEQGVVPDTPVITCDNNTLTATNTSGDYQWYNGNQPISGATDTVFYVTEDGSYQLEVTSQTGCVVTSNTVDSCFIFTGLTEANSLDVAVFPNPVTDALTLKLSDTFNGNVSVKNQLGQQVHETQLNGQSQYQFSVAQLPAGIYSISLSNSQKSSVVRFVKQ